MFMSDVYKKDEIKAIATQDLRKLGIKCRPKKIKSNVQTVKNGTKVFKRPLTLLSTQTVTLRTGQQIIVPKLVHELCSFILTKIETEGLFRKEGSKARQNEIKIILDAGCLLGDEHHVIDVAVVLKTFLRELPEPLIPYNYHELFLRCVLLDKNKLQAILLACLLLPIEHLNVLSYLMQFFLEITEYCKTNKMTAYNLAVVIGPSLFPVEEKLSPNPQIRMTKTCEIFKLLIENGRTIGVLPEDIIERIGNLSSNSNEESNDKKKKKRRSGSLTRMFNGLRKIVGSKSVEEISPSVNITPDLLLTPINRSIKKRKIDVNGFSNKKKKELLNKLPEKALLNTPYTPCQTPVNRNPRVKCDEELNSIKKDVVNSNNNNNAKEKKLQWYLRGKPTKKEEDGKNTNTIIPKSILERRWSVITQPNLKRNKKRNSCAASLLPSTKNKFNNIITNNNNNNNENMKTEPDYVRVSKVEYEEIKNRVTAIERRISFELENVQSKILVDNQNDKNNKNVDEMNVKNVQTAYEQTLVQTEPLSPTTDHLAKRLSRELKIRRCPEQKIIRSPSARKIGSMRRRSRELEKINSKLTRHQSWHTITTNEMKRMSLNRPKSNTNSTNVSQDNNVNQTIKKELKRITRSSSLHNNVNTENKFNSINSQVSCNVSGNSIEKWTSAEGFFSTKKSLNDSSDSLNDRASLAKLRSQNAGMVLAKAKLFNDLVDSDNSDSVNNRKKLLPRVKVNANKLGSARNIESRLSYRVRALKNEDCNKMKKNLSPRRKCNVNLSYKQKLQIAKQLTTSDCKPVVMNKENNLCNIQANVVPDKTQSTTPLKDHNRIDNQDLRPKILSPKYTTPYIKKSLIAKSPKRLCRTPLGFDRNTPLKVLSIPH